MRIKFVKMNGLGNDYIFIDTDKNPPLGCANRLAKAMSCRNFGVGGDGIVTLTTKNGQPRMRIFNADGSEAEMCGNALRCAAIYFRDAGKVGQDKFQILTNAGEKTVEILPSDAQKLVRANMGKPFFYDASPAHEGYKFVNIGNPHAVRAVRGLDDKSFAEARAVSHAVSGGVNVEHVLVKDENNIKMRVYERGSGETLACGTGATAAVFALRSAGFLAKKVKCSLKGGILTVEEQPDGTYTAEGEVRYSFVGEYDAE